MNPLFLIEKRHALPIPLTPNMRDSQGKPFEVDGRTVFDLEGAVYEWGGTKRALERAYANALKNEQSEMEEMKRSALKPGDIVAGLNDGGVTGGEVVEQWPDLVVIENHARDERYAFRRDELVLVWPVDGDRVLVRVSETMKRSIEAVRRKTYASITDADAIELLLGTLAALDEKLWSALLSPDTIAGVERAVRTWAGLPKRKGRNKGRSAATGGAR